MVYIDPIVYDLLNDFSSFVLQISPGTAHSFLIFYNKNNREIEPVVLHTIDKYQMPWGYVELYKR